VGVAGTQPLLGPSGRRRLRRGRYEQAEQLVGVLGEGIVVVAAQPLGDGFDLRERGVRGSSFLGDLATTQRRLGLLGAGAVFLGGFL
jgi:hypothetical protein